ncbi:MAG: tripartite tricarboxylate transporter substrate binding protein [Betaproteobacteria bacterium]|nr:tripartite tricarboxylate transporter substrate binding protein [Betaproteobacteria bacterium]NBQ94249.1 tripartite tricarboxylate transporter substrate binding protein [Betaproteobacteria bacterium]NBS39319.1 tripartite tricarboxylate transporter substrate binding protein [Betaproteobacteria bacterium]NBT71769.1 tripartite tricarboxylate transporter substrate binding protein [Betaproteobacteria bacterium]
MDRRLFVKSSCYTVAGSLIPLRVNAQKLGAEAKILCGFPAGGTADLLSRIFAESARSEVGQAVVVETKTGASGFIANQALSNAPNDGRTVGLVAMASMCVAPVMPGQKIPINVDADLTPVGNFAGITNILVIGKHTKFRSVQELIDQAKKNPGKITYASSGNGTSQHLSGELFKKLAGIDLLHVPYRGGAPAILDIVAGNCDIMFGNMPEYLPQINAGNLIPLAFGSPRPSPLFPNLPLMSSVLPEFVVVNWFAIYGPKAMSAEWVNFWNRTLRTIVGKSDVQKRFVDNGIDIVVSSPDELRSTVLADRKKWQTVIQSAGIRAD